MKPTSVLLLLHADRAIRARPRTVSSDHVRAAGGIRARWPTPVLFASIGSAPQRLPSHIPLRCSPPSTHWSGESGSSVRIAPREGSLSLPCIPQASVGAPCPTPSALDNRATTRRFIPTEKRGGVPNRGLLSRDSSKLLAVSLQRSAAYSSASTFLS